jgi:hypothetical protein
MIGMAAVLRARDASRRALCVSNLKQIAQALHSYQATHGSYPLGVTASFNTFSAAMSAGVRTQGQPTDWSGWSAQALRNYLNTAKRPEACSLFDTITTHRPIGLIPGS